MCIAETLSSLFCYQVAQKQSFNSPRLFQAKINFPDGRINGYGIDTRYHRNKLLPLSNFVRNAYLNILITTNFRDFLLQNLFH